MGVLISLENKLFIVTVFVYHIPIFKDILGIELRVVACAWETKIRIVVQGYPEQNLSKSHLKQ
jgi:hypothetical protein